MTKCYCMPSSQNDGDWPALAATQRLAQSSFNLHLGITTRRDCSASAAVMFQRRIRVCDAGRANDPRWFAVHRILSVAADPPSPRVLPFISLSNHLDIVGGGEWDH